MSTGQPDDAPWTPRAQRYHVPSLNLIVDAHGGFLGTEIINVSETGFLVRITRHTPIGADIDVYPVCPCDEHLPLAFAARVERCEPDAEGFQMAATFAHSSRMDALVFAAFLKDNGQRCCDTQKACSISDIQK